MPRTKQDREEAMRRYEVQEFGQPLQPHDYPPLTPTGTEVLLSVRGRRLP
jgi:hypothetical protein